MSEAKVKAIYSRDFNWRRPKANLAFSIKASDDPQTFPRDVTQAAIEAGAAKAVPPKKAGEAASSAEAGS